MEISPFKVGWKYFTIKPGEQCAMMDGTLRTPTWLAASLDFRELLKYIVPRLLEEERDQYGWTTYSVLERRIHWQCGHRGWGVLRSCYHGEDAGVMCYPGSKDNSVSEY